MDEALEKCVFEIIANECDQKEDLPDVCKIALLKYYSDKEYTGELEDVFIRYYGKCAKNN